MKKTVGLLSLLFPVLMTPASAQEQHENLALAVTSSTVVWATVHRTPQHDDPHYHVEVFEKKKGSEPWLYKRLIPHLAVTPEALAASRVDKQARLYTYKDLEFRLAYQAWLSNRENTPLFARRTSLAAWADKPISIQDLGTPLIRPRGQRLTEK